MSEELKLLQTKIYKYCAYQERSTQEVKIKLNELGANQEEIDWLIADLQQENFLNERRFAATMIRGKFSIKRWGKNKIKATLREKGIDGGLFDRIWQQEIDHKDYLNTLRYWIDRKKEEYQDLDTREGKARLVRFLLQKGFENQWIYPILREELED